MVEDIKSIRKFFKNPHNLEGQWIFATMAATIRIGGVDSRWQIFCRYCLTVKEQTQDLRNLTVLSLEAPLAIMKRPHKIVSV